MVFTAALLGAQHKRRDRVEKKPPSLLAVSLDKALNGIPPPLCGRQVAWLPVLHRVTIVQPLTQHVVRGDFGYPTMAVRLVGGGATSHSLLV